MTSLRKAKGLGSNDGSRTETLLADAQKTLEHLEQVEADFVARDDIHREDVLAAAELETRERCQSIRWTMEKDPQRLSAEDEAFYARHECRQCTP